MPDYQEPRAPGADPTWGGGVNRRQADDASYKSAAYRRMAAGWQICSDLLGGTPVMRAAAERHLPKAPAETLKEYERRKAVAELFNGFGRTVKGLTGMVFRRNPTLEEDMPEALTADWENIDGAGTHGDVFCKQVFEDALAKGHAGILVDYPTIPAELRDRYTLADVKEQNLRPYWVHYCAEQIISWRTTRMGGKTVLTQLVLKEEATVPEGMFGESTKCRYRVFRRRQGLQREVLVEFVLYEEQRRATEVVLVEVRRGVMAKQTEIPFAVVYAGTKEAILESRPPLLDLAYTNIAHWQVQSDHRHSLHIAGVPILVFKGRDTSAAESKEQVVGPNVGIDVDKDGDVLYVEHAGSALGQSRQELKDLEQRMAALGLAMLQSDTRAAETAEAKRIDKSEQDSALATAARGLSDAMEQAFMFHAAYIGLEAGSVKVNQDFEHLNYDATMISALSTLQVAGQISLDTLWDMLQSGNILPQSFDRDKERLLIMTSMNSGGQDGNGDGTEDDTGGDQLPGDKKPPKDAPPKDAPSE